MAASPVPGRSTVLIVGAGPAGLAAALELRQWGVDVTIIDALKAPRTTSRAGGIQPRTYEILERYGMSDMLTAGRQGNKGYSIYMDGKPVGRIETGLARSRYAAAPGVPQADFEQVYRDVLAAAGVTVNWGHELQSLTQDDAGVDAKIVGPDGEISHRADWVIGGDGAHSTVRKLAGIAFAGVSYPEAWGLMDAHLDWAHGADTLHIFKSSSSPQQLIVAPFSETSFRLQIDHRDPAVAGSPPDVAEMQQAFDRLTGLSGTISAPTWASDFRLHRRQAERYRAGRVFLAGDSAHIHAPAGAQGLNTGVQDAINLGWKLGMVATGSADPALLETYEAERWPVADAVLKLAEALVQNPQAAVRSPDMPPQLLADTQAQLLVNYRDGPLGQPRNSAAPLVAGDRLPDVAVDGQSIYRRLRGASMIVALFGDEAGNAAAAALLARFGNAITIWRHAPGDPLAQALGLTQGAAAIRPDSFLGPIEPGKPETATDRLAAWLEQRLGLRARTPSPAE